jgi:hypothetical protein
MYQRCRWGVAVFTADTGSFKDFIVHCILASLHIFPMVWKEQFLILRTGIRKRESKEVNGRMMHIEREMEMSINT